MKIKTWERCVRVAGGGLLILIGLALGHLWGTYTSQADIEVAEEVGFRKVVTVRPHIVDPKLVFDSTRIGYEYLMTVHSDTLSCDTIWYVDSTEIPDSYLSEPVFIE
jgi:hypothetical protein